MWREWGIRKRLAVVALLPGTIVAVLLTINFFVVRFAEMDSELRDRGETLARQMAPAAEYGAFAGNRAELQRLALATLREAETTGLSFFDSNGHLLASAGVLRFEQSPSGLPEGWVGTSADGMTLFFKANIVNHASGLDESFQSPIERKALGSLVLEMSRTQVMARKDQVLMTTLLLTLAFLGFSLALALRLGRDVAEPIVALEHMVAAIGEGHLEARVSPHPAGTVRKLEEGINKMAAALARARERAEARLALTESEKRTQEEFSTALIEAQSDGGVGTVILEGGRVTYANEAVAAITGFSVAEVLAMPSFLRLVHPKARNRVNKRYAELVQGKVAPRQGEVTVLTHQGARRVFSLALALQIGPAGPRLVCVGVDSTERRRSQQQLALALEALRRQRDKAEQISTAKSRFLAAASHDLRQPMHAMTLFVEYLKESARGENEGRLARQMAEALGSANAVIDSLLEISRLDLAELQVHRQPLALAPLLERLVTRHRLEAQAKGLSLHLHPTNAWTDSDPLLLERSIDNLLSNALRYTEKGGVLIGVRWMRKQWRLEIWDTGIGISEEHLPHLFQEFYQVGNPERALNRGLGLGLAIVDRLSRVLDYGVGVTSRPGHGSRFFLTLPRVTPEPMLPAAVPDANTDFDAQVILGLDAGMEAEEITRLLRGWGCQVTRLDPLEPLPAGADVVICNREFLNHRGDVVDGLGGLPVVLLGEGGDAKLSGDMTRTVLPLPLRPARLRALLHHLLVAEAGSDP